jgi:hypothetical protein
LKDKTCNKYLTTDVLLSYNIISPMKMLFTSLFCFLFTQFVTAQNNFTVTGKVLNQLTGLPMAAASVFAQNTTLGTVTDDNGNFKLSLPQGGYDLIITFTGYRTETRRITTVDANENIIINLKEKEKELETVAILSTNEVMDGLAKYGSFFNEEFIGKTENSKRTAIQNPEVLHFFFSKKKNRLKITATEPLIIKNEGLGYNIKYTIDSFTHEYVSGTSTYTGSPLYEEMQGDSTQRSIWLANRKAAYNGSLLHFMRSVYSKDLKAQQFEIQFIIQQNGKDNAIKLKDTYTAINYEKDDSTQTVEILPNQKDVGILFMGEKPSAAYLSDHPTEPKDFKFSMLSFRPNESIIIEQNGYFYDQNDISISGYWTWDKVGEQLPYDYK